MYFCRILSSWCRKINLIIKQDILETERVIPLDNELINEIYTNIMTYLPKLPSALIILGLGSILIDFLNRMVTRIMKKFHLDEALIGFVKGFITFACWVFLVAIIFAVMGLPQISVAFSGSIALILVGVASNANSMIQDLLAGIFLIADHDFTVGAKVKVNNISGTVTSLDIKKTKIRDDDGNLHVVSNKTFDSSVYVIYPESEQNS